MKASFFHAALSVKSIEKSRNFYETLFGLRLKSKGERRELGVHFIYLEDNNHSGVELFEHKDPHALVDNRKRLGFP